jgi:hypothetical protein
MRLTPKWPIREADINQIEIPQRSSAVLSLSKAWEVLAVKRREFITLLGGTAAGWPLAAHVETTKVARFGFLGLVSASSHASRTAAFRAGLRDLGWIEGRNLLLEFRWAEGNYDRLPILAEELLRLNIDVLLAHGAAGALAAKKHNFDHSDRAAA